MSVDADSDDVGPTPDVADELAQELGEAILELEEYDRFLETKEAVENDDAAQSQIQTFESIRESFVQARQNGTADQAQLKELQDAQEQLHAIDVMAAYLAAQNDLEMRLQQLNRTISLDLEVDFGTKAGGCCQD